MPIRNEKLTAHLNLPTDFLDEWNEDDIKAFNLMYPQPSESEYEYEYECEEEEEENAPDDDAPTSEINTAFHTHGDTLQEWSRFVSNNKYSSARTSQSHPLKPAWIRAINGHLGLSICPAKKGDGQVGLHNRDYETDMKSLTDSGVDKIYGLMPTSELEFMSATAIINGPIPYRHLPMEDRGVPEGDNSLFSSAIAEASQDMVEGRRILIHCRGGLGRTGIFAGCVLAICGWHVDDIIKALQNARGVQCPETDAQRTFLRTFCVSQMLGDNKHLRPIKDIQASAIANAIKTHWWF